MATRILSNTWLGLKFSQAGQVPNSWEDGSPVTYQNWKKDEPKNDPDYMCPLMIGSDDKNYGRWKVKIKGMRA